MTLTKLLSNIEIDTDKIVIQELLQLRESFIEDIKTIETTGKPVGYDSWDSAEADKKEIEEVIKALNSVLKLFGE